MKILCINWHGKLQIYIFPFNDSTQTYLKTGIMMSIFKKKIFYSRPPEWKVLYNWLSSNYKTFNFVSYWTSLWAGVPYRTVAVASAGFDAH